MSLFKIMRNAAIAALLVSSMFSQANAGEMSCCCCKKEMSCCKKEAECCKPKENSKGSSILSEPKTGPAVSR